MAAFRSPRLSTDGIDSAILEILRRDGRASFTDMANELKVSDVTIHLRIKKLLERGIIKNFSANLDYSKLGFPLIAFVELKIAPGTIARVTESILGLEGVIEVYELHSHCDLMIKVRARDLNDLRDKVVLGIRTKLRQDLLSDDVHPVLKIVKEGGDISIPLTRDMPPVSVSRKSKVVFVV